MKIYLPIAFLFVLISACGGAKRNQSNTPKTIVKRDTIRINDCDQGKEIAILSASVNNLYWKCGNTVSLDVPSNASNIKLQCSQGSVLASKSDKKKFSIVPSGKKAVLGITYDINGINEKKTRTFKVIKPPKPSVQGLANGKQYNGVSVISKKSRMMVRVRPDADFKSILPKDARYAISKVDLLVQRSLGVPTRVGSWSGSGKDATKGIPISLGNKLKSDPPGTKAYLKIDKLYRINFQNKKVEVKLSEKDKVIGFTIK